MRVSVTEYESGPVIPPYHTHSSNEIENNKFENRSDFLDRTASK